MDCSLDSEHILQVSSKIIFNNKRDTTKCQSFCMLTLKAIVIPQVFSETAALKICRTRLRTFLRIVGKYGPSVSTRKRELTYEQTGKEGNVTIQYFLIDYEPAGCLLPPTGGIFRTMIFFSPKVS